MNNRLILLILFAFCAVPLMAQQTVSGKVTSAEDGEPLIGVTVLIKGTSQGTVTDFDGQYSIDVPSTDVILQFSYTGYASQEVSVGTQSVIDVSLDAGVLLDEVVVTSLGMEREKKSLSYSVTEVGGEIFQEAREVNLANALAGKVAGVNVSNIASGPQGSSRVIIRGNTSLGGNNQPLYVVDGVPLDNQDFGQAGLWGGYDEGDGMSSVNPDDIATISVLKGANAAALYGSRASNGVILITTKSGKSRKGLGIEYTSNFTAEEFIDHYDYQDQYGQGRQGRAPVDAAEAWDLGNGSNWGERLDGSLVPQFDGVSRPYTFQAKENLKRFYRTGYNWTNTLGLTGGNEDHQVRLNLSNLQNESIIPNSGFDRYNASLSYSGNFGDRLTITSKILYSYEFAQNRPRLADSPGNAPQGLITLPVNYNVDDLRGDPNKLGSVPEGVTTPDNKIPGEEYQISANLWNQNPWFAAYQFQNDSKRDRVVTSNVARFNVTDFLYVQGRVGMDWYTRRRTNLTPYGTGYQRTGSLNEQERRVREINLEGIVGFNDNYGDFSIDAFAGGNRMRRSDESLNLNGNTFNIPFFYTFSNLQNQSPGYGFGEEGINSVFGSVTFGYKSFLYLTGTARQDWFSTLNPDDNSILYPSVGGSLIFTELMDLSTTSFLTFGKFRASWAQVGGDTDPYRLNLTYGLGQGHLGIPNASIQQSSIPNPFLTP